jgi:hypothetical protein
MAARAAQALGVVWLELTGEKRAPAPDSTGTSGRDVHGHQRDADRQHNERQDAD